MNALANSWVLRGVPTLPSMHMTYEADAKMLWDSEINAFTAAMFTSTPPSIIPADSVAGSTETKARRLDLVAELAGCAWDAKFIWIKSLHAPIRAFNSFSKDRWRDSAARSRPAVSRSNVAGEGSNSGTATILIVVSLAQGVATAPEVENATQSSCLFFKC